MRHGVTNKTGIIAGSDAANTGDRDLGKSERELIRERVIEKLITEKGYRREDMELGKVVHAKLDGRNYVSPVDIIIKLKGKRILLIKCAPGSVVTRENQVLAAARLLDKYQIPLGCQTNGDEIEVLDVLKGKVIAEGWEKFPTKEELARLIGNLKFEPLPEKHRIRESRILRLYDELT